MALTHPEGAKRVLAAPRRQRGRYAAFSPRLATFLTASDFALGFTPKRGGGPLKPGGPWRVLFSNTAHLGDMVVHLPLLARLAASPQVSVLSVLTSPAGAAVVSAFLPDIGAFRTDHWSLNRGPGGRIGKIVGDLRARGDVVRALRAEAFDVAIDSYGWFGNAATTLWSARIPVRLGFESGGGGALYTHASPFAFPGPLTSVAERTAGLLAPLLAAGLTLPDHAPLAFMPDPLALELAQGTGQYAVLHLGRGEHVQAWTEVGWRETALGLKARGYRLVFTGAAAEADYGRALRAELADHDLVGQGGLAFFATVLQQAALLVSVDTVAPHLAALFETPTVVVASQKQALHLWRPPHARVRQVTTPVGCGPCFRKDGCEAMACIRETPASAVLAAVDEVLA